MFLRRPLWLQWTEWVFLLQLKGKCPGVDDTHGTTSGCVDGSRELGRKSIILTALCDAFGCQTRGTQRARPVEFPASLIRIHNCGCYKCNCRSDTYHSASFFGYSFMGGSFSRSQARLCPCSPPLFTFPFQLHW